MARYCVGEDELGPGHIIVSGPYTSPNECLDGCDGGGSAPSPPSPPSPPTTLGNLFVWGDNSSGQLGDGTQTIRNSPFQVGSLSWAMIDGGQTFGAGITSTGDLYTWGYDDGSLGHGTNTLGFVNPTQVGSSKWLKLSCGVKHTVAIRSDGTLWAWGLNSSGQLGDATTTNRLSPVQIGTSLWSAVSCGDNFTVAIGSDGIMYAWGGAALQWDGGGGGLRPYPTQTSGNWNSASAGAQHMYAIKSSGGIHAWGQDPTYGSKAGDQIATGSWSFVSCRGGRSHAIRSTDNSLWSTGDNFTGELGIGSAGNNQIPWTQVDGEWSSVSCGLAHSVGLKTDGTLWAWGENSSGAVGDGTTIQRNSPVQIGSGWSGAFAGYYSSYGLKT